MTRKLITSEGGTRAWGRLVAFVLIRDGFTCRMMRDGHICGAPATTANHRVHRALGGPDTLDNLEAACLPCNMADGGRLAQRLAATAQARHDSLVAIVQALDVAGVPANAGRRQAKAALDAHTSHPWRGVDIEAACMYRRNRGPLTRI